MIAIAHNVLSSRSALYIIIIIMIDIEYLLPILYKRRERYWIVFIDIIIYIIIPPCLSVCGPFNKSGGLYYIYLYNVRYNNNILFRVYIQFIVYDNIHYFLKPSWKRAVHYDIISRRPPRDNGSDRTI